MGKKASSDELVFLPLGGAGEIGMNLNLYGYGPPDEREWVLVDLGVTFNDPSAPGVEVVMPDPTYIADLHEDLLGIVLTHAHEDHIGAVAHLWPQLKAPVWATPFTAALLMEKLKEKGIEDDVRLTIVPLGGHIKLGPFDIELITLTHSIPEPNGLAITTPLGTVLHTGDWKIDPEPVIGAPTDEARVRELGDNGVLAMICDSTNVFSDGRAGSESEVSGNLRELISAQRGRVAVGAFASNVARLQSVIEAADACGRSVCLVGRSMKRVCAAARSVGMLAHVRPFVDEGEASHLSRDQVLYLATGSQGEARAALMKIAREEFPGVTLDRGDSVIFSSRVIPGNEVSIGKMQNTFVDRGVKVITDRDAHIHVSGHPCRDELRDMYQWARPRIAIPVHGEARHIAEHVQLAKSLQVPEAIGARNGDMIRLAPGPAEVIDEVPSGRWYLDGTDLIPEGHSAIRDRRRLSMDGLVTVALVIDGKRRIKSGPDVRVVGLASPAGEEQEDQRLDVLADAAEAAVQHHKGGADSDMEGAVIRAVKKAAYRLWGKRPHVEAVVLDI
jgi:ribonuclease J